MVTKANCPLAYLEHYPKRAGGLQRFAIDRVPFEIGRSTEADYTIYSSRVSKRHAVILWQDGSYCVRDHGTTNGTFVNGERIEETLLTNGDILHVADKEFRFYLDLTGDQPPDCATGTNGMARPARGRHAEPHSWWKVPARTASATSRLGRLPTDRGPGVAASHRL